MFMLLNPKVTTLEELTACNLPNYHQVFSKTLCTPSSTTTRNIKSILLAQQMISKCFITTHVQKIWSKVSWISCNNKIKHYKTSPPKLIKSQNRVFNMLKSSRKCNKSTSFHDVGRRIWKKLYPCTSKIKKVSLPLLLLNFAWKFKVSKLIPSNLFKCSLAVMTISMNLDWLKISGFHFTEKGISSNFCLMAAWRSDCSTTKMNK